jgi:hypothetical protein
MKLIFCFLLCFFLPTSWIFAQTINGNLEGRVLDETGQPVQGVNVTVSGPNLIGTRGAATNDDGLFRIFALPAGSYSIKISHISYRERTVNGITVQLGTTTKLPDLYLQQQIMEAGEVVVWADQPVMDPASTSLGENLTPDQLEGLPLERNYQAIAKLLPQANESYFGDGLSIMGATGLENKFFINGVDVSDPFRGKTSTSLPYNFVREVQVRTGAYEAEYRGSLGGLMSVTTYAGGNDFSGQLYGFFTNNKFSGTPRPSETAMRPSTSDYFQVKRCIKINKISQIVNKNTGRRNQLGNNCHSRS